ncbi:cysteine protease ATG4D [Teleopsis dalmanni]|uniref:cysteine protease ATG4D n=1 Tax=Teleopsis dalmanni TaxID=139649 RepID=UPI0018CD3BBD|nr:cysteine protease ATG4D [Teleopsis dalmanni]
MNYDGILAQITDEKLNVYQSQANAVEEQGAVEEEQVATIQTVQQSPAVRSKSNSESSTPQRKISASTRFMNAFQQFYTATSNSNSAPAPAPTTHIENNDSDTATLGSNRTPTKSGTMESKLLSMWHNVKYGWSGKLKSNFSKEQPVWLLGRCYHRKYTPPASLETSADLTNCITSTANDAIILDGTTTLSFDGNICESMQPNVSSLYPVLNPQHIDEIVVPQELGMDAAENQGADIQWEESIEGFRRDFYSRIWMTYRREFQTMNGSNYTSDCGWGCMLRSGQMLLAQGLVCHFLGRSWRYNADTQLHSTYEDITHKKIIKWFGDSSSKNSPFSIHTLVRLGEEMGKKPGDWYGPASVSYLLRRALKTAAQENADFDNINIYVARDCTIYIQDIEDECRIPEPTPQFVPWQMARKIPKQERKMWKSLIILIPLRLGTEKINPVYAHCLKLLLSTEYCIGIIGGRPKHSLYFVGFQEDKLIHLDPHYCQEMVDVNMENFPLHTFHCKSPRKLKTSKMDPSCCIGFYIPTKNDFDQFVESVQLYLHPMRCASGTIDKIIPPAQQLPCMATSYDGSTAATQFAEMNYPLFSFSRGRCLDHETDEMSDSLYKPVQEQMAQVCQDKYLTDDEDGETEEFVLL